MQPGQAVGTYEDVIKRLRDRLHYLYGEKDSYWFDTRPNLRRRMESRKANLKDADDVMPLLRDRVGRVFSKGNHFAGIHVFTPSTDVPDDFGLGPRLVVLPPMRVTASRTNRWPCWLPLRCSKSGAMPHG